MSHIDTSATFQPALLIDSIKLDINLSKNDLHKFCIKLVKKKWEKSAAKLVKKVDDEGKDTETEW